jgi:hypothetical protein
VGWSEVLQDLTIIEPRSLVKEKHMQIARLFTFSLESSDDLFRAVKTTPTRLAHALAMASLGGAKGKRPAEMIISGIDSGRIQGPELHYLATVGLMKLLKEGAGAPSVGMIMLYMTKPIPPEMVELFREMPEEVLAQLPPPVQAHIRKALG